MKVPLKGHGRLSFARNELRKETNDIKTQFQNFVDQLQQHLLLLLENGTLDVSTIKSHLIMYDPKLKGPLNPSKSLQDVFKTLSSPEHSTFLDYELVKLLTDYGDNAIKENFICYKRNLQKFLENRIIEQSTSEDEKSYAVVLDESITNEISDLVRLENGVKMILGHQNLRLEMKPTEDRAGGEVLGDDSSDKDFLEAGTGAATLNPPQSKDFDEDASSSQTATSQQDRPEKSDTAEVVVDPPQDGSEGDNSTTIESSPMDTSLSGIVVNDHQPVVLQ